MFTGNTVNWKRCQTKCDWLQTEDELRKHTHIFNEKHFEMLKSNHRRQRLTNGEMKERKKKSNELKWNYVNKIQFVNETNTRIEY